LFKYIAFKPGKSHTNIGYSQELKTTLLADYVRPINIALNQLFLLQLSCKNENTATSKVVAMNDSRNQLFMDWKGKIQWTIVHWL